MKEKYDTNVRSKDKNKIEVNKTIQELGSIRRRNKGVAIILDTEKVSTRRALVKAGFKRKNIHIPNPFVYEKLKYRHNNTYNYLLGTFLNTPMVDGLELQGKTTLAFFDYMSTLDGSKTTNIYPKEDIKEYFWNKYPSDDSIFAVTISLRTGTKSKGTCYDVSMLDHYVTKNAHENGYIAVKLKISKAYNGMFFTAYRIFKQ